MMPTWKRVLLALALALTSFWAFSRFGGGSSATNTPALAPIAPPQLPITPTTPVKPKPAAPKKIARPPVKAARGAGLREKGEALGGSTPDRVDKATETKTSIR